MPNLKKSGVTFSGFTFLQSKKAKLELKSFLPLAKINSGFTLIEILISITIIAILTAVSIPNLRRFNQGEALDTATSDLTRVLRLSQSSAMTGIKCSSSQSKNWSVSLNPTTKTYQLTAACEGTPTEETNLTDTLPQDITVSTPSCATLSKIVFTSNSVAFFCDGVSLATQTMSITLTNRFSQIKTISVSTGGSISEQ